MEERMCGGRVRMTLELVKQLLALPDGVDVVSARVIAREGVLEMVLEGDSGIGLPGKDPGAEAKQVCYSILRGEDGRPVFGEWI